MIKLNLGCGDKILPGYINVDVASERKGKKPDVISDIRKLTFDDNYADEILSVHVIEHCEPRDMRIVGEKNKLNFTFNYKI
jgi:predicted SAM-dependent methyltransferase